MTKIKINKFTEIYFSKVILMLTNSKKYKKTSLKYKKSKKNKNINYDNVFKLKNLKKFNLSDFLNNLSKNKLFIGLVMIFMNIGSRFVEFKFTKGQEMLLKSVAREVLIFSIAFMGSRDLFVALIITAIFIILGNYIFNENSKYNMMPKRFKNIENAMDLNNDGKISQEEIDKAHSILKKAKDQTNINNKNRVINNFNK